MENHPGKQSLADDPNFLASLSDLDRGLDVEQHDRYRMPATRPPLVPPVVMHAPAAPPATQPAPLRTPDRLPPLVVQPGSRRPLLDLFPTSPTDRLRPPGPLPDTAVGPQLPASAEPRATAAPAARADTCETFYGLLEKPFSVSTDLKFLYHSTAHDRAAQQMLTAIRNREGMTLLTGDVGAGKTMLCRAISEEIDRRTLTSVIVDPIDSLETLLRTILLDFGVVSHDDLARAPEPPSRETLTAAFRSFVASLGSLQASAVLVIDEAQNVPVHVLAELPTLVHDSQPIRTLEVILVGQPGLAKLLKRRELRALNAQITVRAHLGPLTPEELGGYVMHRVGVVGGSRSRIDFDETALERISALSEGLPRTVNLLCDRALTRGFEGATGVIDASFVEAAAVDLELVPPAARHGGLRTALASAAFFALMLVGAATALFVFRDTAARTITVWERVPPPPAGPLKLVPPPLAPIDPSAQ